MKKKHKNRESPKLKNCPHALSTCQNTSISQLKETSSPNHRMTTTRAAIAIELLKNYHGELDDNKIVLLGKIAHYISLAHKNEKIAIPEENYIEKALSTQTEEDITNLILATFDDPSKVNLVLLKKEIAKTPMDTMDFLKDVTEILSCSENKHLSLQTLSKIGEIARSLYAATFGCINETIKMEEEKSGSSPSQSEAENIPIANSEDNSKVPEVDVNVKFTERLKTLGVDLDKIDRKLKVFETQFDEHGEDVEYFMKAKSPSKEVENMIRGGIEINELSMKVLLDLDSYLGLNDENKSKRKDLIINIQDKLDEVEKKIKRLRVTKLKVDKKLDDERKVKEAIEQERLAKEKAMKEEEARKMEEEKSEDERNQELLARQKEEEARKREEAERQRVIEERKEKKRKELEERQKQNQRYVKPKRTYNEQEDEEHETMKEKKNYGEIIRNSIDWKAMKLPVKFGVQERGNNIVVVGNISGLNEDDINVEITKSGYLKISGVKEPNEQEMSLMVRSVKQRYGEIEDDEMVEMVSKYCKGRFGMFSQIYEIPEYVDVQGITMNYDEDILTVTLPKKYRRQERSPFGNYNMGYNPFW
ncbi:hypothetical protein EIN_055730 [Entamoeba invadens IP1]|uniref:hypothetical protein n=1 Tax=Entamoeba invadens IP1 TaxID=370355 RepID=UPI0002C3E74C|nr:hypothetical protein EIN_055730 [Entamoeba invadens IP1]ELP93228.1 hypothetical protein EIN_055730 [Entamoeba invadens IP1]|eukprot:XP_004259999.1 hypothetical protein EIN_055730 [Entamoeba invadens IP1]